MTRGALRVYLGAAPGVGKTFAMLDEGHRRCERGTDVVIAFVEDHGREHTRQACQGLETIPRRILAHRGTDFAEMDLDAVLARRPQVALVDELAHTNVPGSRNAKRWQDVDELLDAGIDVISTINVQHLESLNDVVVKVTGVPQRETVPDAVVRRAEQVDLVDMSPEALRRRMAHGNIYAADKVDAALGNYFRIGNLTALRELALLWLADKVDQGLKDYRHAQGIESTWEARERVVVALTGGPEGETLVRRASRIAQRQAGGDLVAVHVARSDGLHGAAPDALARQRALVESLGGSYHVVVGDEVAAALLDFARAQNTTQLVLGASRRGRFASIFGSATSAAVVRGSGSIDVHLVTHERVGAGHGQPNLASGLTVERRFAGAVVGVACLPLLTLGLAHSRDTLSLPSQLLLYLCLVIVVSFVGGIYPAVVTALLATLLLNYYFTPPLHELTIKDPENILALVVFLLVAGAVSSLVELAARRTRQAARAGAQAEALATLSGDVLRGERTLSALVMRTRDFFALDGVRLLERVEGTDMTVAESGELAQGGITEVQVTDDVRLQLSGRKIADADLRVLRAFSAQTAAALERRHLAIRADQAAQLSLVDRLRTSLLAAVGHDLRTPLAAAKAAVSSLRTDDVQWSRDEHAELLATAEESLDQLDDVVTNLLDMSRLQAGALALTCERLSLADVLPHAATTATNPAVRIDAALPEDLPDVLADAGLLDRVLANLLANAARHAPAGSAVRLSASQIGDRVEVRVVDRGPGISDADKDKVFEPFQRLDDRSSSGHGAGVGLGLAVARGFVEAMGGTLVPEDTPGGGLTMTVSLPVARSEAR